MKGCMAPTCSYSGLNLPDKRYATARFTVRHFDLVLVVCSPVTQCDRLSYAVLPQRCLLSRDIDDP